MSIFKYDDYKQYIRDRIASMPKRGRGELQRMAGALRVHTSLLSQIFSGDKNLSFEQAATLSEYLGLNELETEFFISLLEFQRAGTAKLRGILKKRLDKLEKQGAQLSNRLQKEAVLTEEARAVFYSNWYYSGIRLLSSVPGQQDIDAIASYFNFPKARVTQVVDFLLSTGLCIQSKDGKITMGPQRTHLEANSPLVQRHHSNWRVKAMQRYESMTEEELSFTGPLAIAAKDIPRVREMLVELIEAVSKLVKDSKSEKLACLNVDFFKF